MGESATTEEPAADLSPSPSPDAPKGAAASETVANGLYPARRPGRSAAVHSHRRIDSLDLGARARGMHLDR